jgi:hypothetical protein
VRGCTPRVSEEHSAQAAETLLDAARGDRMSLYLGYGDLPYQVFFDTIPPAHLDFFDGLLPYYRDASGIYTHGGVDPRIARFEDQPARALI